MLWQVAAWPDTFDKVAAQLSCSRFVSVDRARPGQSVANASTALLRTEPLKFWMVGTAPPVFDAADAVTVDLSHSRTLVKLQGEHATTVLNSYLPLDLRDTSFPAGSVASSAFHHCSVTLWRSEHNYELFLPRGFAR